MVVLFIIELYNKSDLSFEEWIKRVSSKGGTTEAAMSTYREKAVREDIMAGARAALNRAVELGAKGEK